MVVIWKSWIVMEITLTPRNAGFRIGDLEAVCATPNLETESSSLGMICLGVVDVKFISKGCILPG